MAAVVCDVPAAGSVDIRLRTSMDAGSWGPWFTAPLEVVDENGAPQAFIDPIWTGAGRYVQVRADRTAARGPGALTGVRLVAIDPTGEASLVASVAGAVRRVAATVAGVALTDTASAAATTPTIVTRAEWGADDTLRSGSPSYAPVKVAFVHHTASGNVYAQADAPGIVRAIYAYHTKTLHWSDIGYNFLIDRYGTIYEGRYGGIARGVIGAQAGGFNTGSTGISVLGTFSDQAPPAVTVAALERLLAWKLGVAGLDPTGTSTLTCGLTDRYVNGAKVTFPVVAGHRQANYTECPGDAFYALLPAIRANVARRSRSIPGRDLERERPAAQSERRRCARRHPVRHRHHGRRRLATHRQGRRRRDRRVLERRGRLGVHHVGRHLRRPRRLRRRVHRRGHGHRGDGGTATASTQVTVDTTAPRLTGAAAPGWLSPNGDGQTESGRRHRTPAEACDVRVGILDADGDVVRWLHGWRARETSPYSVTWDGKVGSASALTAAADGQYRFDIERRDAAGNVARRGIGITVDRTVGYPAALPATFSPGNDGARDTTALGFKLTRTAEVTVRVLAGADVVRTLPLGTLTAGAHSATWTAGPGRASTSPAPGPRTPSRPSPRWARPA